MKKALSYLLLGCLLTLAAVNLGAVPGSRETVMGEVIDIAGYAMRDSRGEESAEAGRFRAEGGFPIGILTESGEVYVAVYKNPAPASSLANANKILGELMGKQIVARGTTYEAQGIRVIQISVASEM